MESEALQPISEQAQITKPDSEAYQSQQEATPSEGQLVDEGMFSANRYRALVFSLKRVRLGDIRGWRWAFLIIVVALVGLLLIGPVIGPPKGMNQHYFYLAKSFSEGKLYVDDMRADHPDAIEWEGHKYLPFGPLPSVLLIPFLPLFSAGVHLLWVGYLFTLLNVWLFYKVMGRFGVRGEQRLWALLLFFGGTVCYSITLVGSSYFFAHIVVVTFLLLAMWETLGGRRVWLIGLLVGLAAMTRLTILSTLPFFVWVLWKKRESEHVDAGVGSRVTFAAKGVGLLIAGLAGPIGLLMCYNYLRFGNALESGYSLATLGIGAFQEARSHGLFSVDHIPKNLVMMLFQGPRAYPAEDAAVLQFPYLAPSQWGMGLIYTSPGLFYAFAAKMKNPLVQACWLGVIFGMIPVITYYGIGWLQFGYRYALDFLPFLVLLAAMGFPTPMTRLAKILVTASVVVSTWGGLFLLAWIYGIHVPW